MQFGGLIRHTSKGHALGLDRQQTFLSYADLVADIIEIVSGGNEYSWQGVSDVSTSNDTKNEWKVSLISSVKGLVAHYMPAVSLEAHRLRRNGAY